MGKPQRSSNLTQNSTFPGPSPPSGIILSPSERKIESFDRPNAEEAAGPCLRIGSVDDKFPRKVKFWRKQISVRRLFQKDHEAVEQKMEVGRIAQCRRLTWRNVRNLQTVELMLERKTAMELGFINDIVRHSRPIMIRNL